MSPRGVKTSSCCSLKCSETAAGHELVSLSPSVHQLPALASRAATHHIRGPRGRPPPVSLLLLLPRYASGGQIKSRFVITTPALGSATGKGSPR